MYKPLRDVMMTLVLGLVLPVFLVIFILTVLRTVLDGFSLWLLSIVDAVLEWATPDAIREHQK